VAFDQTQLDHVNMVFRLIVLAHAILGALAAEQGVISSTSANPIRKVVNLLQAMQKKVAEEGEKASELHEKYMCYCKGSGGNLASSISAAETKIPELTASIESGSAEKAQNDGDLKSHQEDRATAKKTMSQATAIRKREKAIFDKSLADNKANVAAVQKATVAIAEGMGGSFLQTANVGVLKALVTSEHDMLTSDRQVVLAFLAGQHEAGYVPASGQIVGILKQMADEMLQDRKDMVSTETDASKSYEGLMSAKKRELAALQKSIETKLERSGSLGVEIATMKNDLEDTSEALDGDRKFAADLKKNCDTRTAIHEQEMNMRAQETVALADTIKILNDDDALELFKKTLPSGSSSLMQVQESSSARRASARQVLSEGSSQLELGQRHGIDFILLALRGQKIGFEKVIELIDALVASLQKEQLDDDNKKEYCAVELDHADDKRKDLENSLSDLQTLIEETKEGIANLAEDIKTLKAGIAALDAAVAEATENRKAENAEYKDLVASNSAAKEVILFAKNRLHKFYSPKLHKSAPTALVQIASHRVVPAPPPATAAAYTKKSEENGGVMSMMDLLVADLDKELTEGETEEKNARSEYEQTMTDSAEKRRQDSKSLTDKESAKADLESSLEQSKDDKMSTAKEHMGTMRYIANLHSECDWLMQYYDVRKTSRADEVDALKGAKSVLSGADYSLLQRDVPVRSRKFLRRA